MPTDSRQRPDRPADRAGALAVGPGFLVLAAWFLWGPDLAPLPSMDAPRVAAEALRTAPRRQVIGDPPAIRLNSFDRTCMDCHRSFRSPQPRTGADRIQHRDIALDHGTHTGCYSCHHEQDRDRLTTLAGEPLAYAEVDRLCQQCHASTHADWRAGMHGRTNGHWLASAGPVRHLGCTECHDPHRPRGPAMDPIEPLPGPSTLRMEGATSGRHGHGNSLDPLRRAIRGESGEHGEHR